MQQPASPPVGYGENIAGRLFEVVRQLQKNRQKTAANAPAVAFGQKVPGGQEVMNALYQQKQNEQKQNASGTPGALQKTRGEEGGRYGNVGQRKA